MTTFSYIIQLNDGERLALEAALNHMIKYCDERLDEGPRAPFTAYRFSFQSIKEKLLRCTPAMTSTNDF